MRAAIYAPVSTNTGQDPSMQTRELREYCQRRTWEIEGEYVDAGVSGAKERRPQLDALLVACRKRRVDAVVLETSSSLQNLPISFDKAVIYSLHPY
jgi:DNA invertase Pin-like site-specific DNA recombinase